MTRTRIKICGVRTPDIARSAVQAGADALGLVFAAGSPRLVSFEEAEAIAHAVPPFVELVGLFVDHDVKQIRSLAEELPITLIQLHGEYDAGAIDALSPHRVMRAVNFDAESVLDTLTYWNQMHRELDNLAGILIDAPAGAQRGGTGEAFDWSALRRAIDQFDPGAGANPGAGAPLILAGGLTSQNVAQAVRIVRPWAVDVSSGVESSRGVKDTRKIAEFCEAVRRV